MAALPTEEEVRGMKVSATKCSALPSRGWCVAAPLLSDRLESSRNGRPRPTNSHPPHPLSNAQVAELRGALESLGLPKSGLKAELMDRLLAHIAAAGAGAAAQVRGAVCIYCVSFSLSNVWRA